MGPSAVRRVLLVEDDALVARFVELALEDLGPELRIASRLAEGLAVLEAGGVELLLADLVLPDGPGTELLERARSLPRPPACIVFSGGVDASTRQRLRALGVRHILDKPASLGALLRAVKSALGMEVEPPPRPPAPAGDVVRRHFGGNAVLFAAYREASVQQFPADIAEGERFCARGDLRGLHRLGHSLKTVLRLLGDAAGAEAAARLEHAARDGERSAQERWQALRDGLRGWVSDPR
jgi:CheY-like chemotaxis protein/HPt (histidine-containing phosphotransfer) domain-containing protein